MNHAPPNVSFSSVVNVAAYHQCSDYRFLIIGWPFFFLIPYAWNQLNAQINDREVAVAAANIMIELKVFYGGTARININYNFMLMHKLCVYLFLSPNILAYPHNSLKMWFVAVISTHLSPHSFHTIGIAYKFLWHVI